MLTAASFWPDGRLVTNLSVGPDSWGCWKTTRQFDRVQFSHYHTL